MKIDKWGTSDARNKDLSDTIEAIGIAGSDLNKMYEFKHKANSIVSKMEVKPWNEKKKSPKAIKIAEKAAEVNKRLTEKILETDFLQKLSEQSDIMKQALSKISTGKDLMNLTIAINEQNKVTMNSRGKNQLMNVTDVQDSIKRTRSILKDGGLILDYDLETLGGTNSAGQGQVDFITELAFNVNEVVSNKGPIEDDFIDYTKWEADSKKIDIEALKKMKKPSMQGKTPEQIMKDSIEWDKRSAILKRYNETGYVLDTKDYLDKKAFEKAKKNFVPTSMKQGQSYSTLLGFDNSEYTQIKNMLANAKGRWRTGEVSDIENLYIQRLSMMSQEGLELDMKDNMFEVNIKHTGTKHDANIERALQGLEKMREIGIHQEKNLGKGFSSYGDYKTFLIGNMQELVTTGKNKHFGIDLTKNGVITGHNIVGFDTNAFEQILGKRFEQNNKITLDTFEIFKYIENYMGKGTHLPSNFIGVSGDKKVLKNGNFQTKAYGTKTMDYINHTLGIVTKDKEAHNAAIDIENHFKAFFGKDEKGKSLFDHIVKQNDLIKMSGVTGGTSELKDSVFLYNGGGKTVYGEQNALSFSVNRVDNEIKFSNGEILGRSADGLVTDNNTGYVGKRNTLYKIKNYSVDINSDVFKNIMKDMEVDQDKFFNKFKGLEHLYVQELEEYMDENVAKEYGIDINNRPVHFRIFTNENEMMNEFTKVYDGLDREVANRVGKMVKDGDSFKFIATQDEIVDLSKETAANSFDTVNRKARDAKAPFLSRYATIKKNGVPHAKMVAELVSKRNTTGEAMMYMNVPANKEWYNQKTDDLYDFIGYKFNGKKHIAQGESGQAQYVDNFLSGFERGIQELEKKGLVDLDGMFDYKEVGGYQVAQKKAWDKTTGRRRSVAAFEALVDEMYERALSGEDSELNNLVRDVSGSVEDFGLIDVLKRDIGGNTFTLGNVNSKDYATINLNSENGLLDTFFNVGFADNIDANKDGREGYTAIKRAFKYFMEDERYGKAALGRMSEDKINDYIREGLSPKAIALKMQESLKQYTFEMNEHGEYTRVGKGLKYRRADVELGTKDARNIISNYLSVDENLADVMKNVQSKLSSNELYDGDEASFKRIQEKIYGQIMFNEEDLLKNLDNLSGEYRDSTLMQLKLAKADALKLSEDVANSIINGDMQVKIGDDSIFVGQNGEFRKLELYKYVQENGIINTQVGNTKYNMEMGLKLSGADKKGYGGPVTLDNLDKLVKPATGNEIVREGLNSPVASVNRAIERGENPVEALIRTMKKVNGGVIDASTMVEYKNFTNMLANNHRFKTKEIFKILPEIGEDLIAVASKTVLKGMEENTDVHTVLLRNAIESMTESANDRGQKGYRFVREGLNGQAMQTENKTAFYRSFEGHLLDAIASMGKDEYEIEIAGKKVKFNNPLRNLDISVKSTAKEHEFFSTVKEIALDPNSNVENHMRDPIYQGSNTVNYNKKDAMEMINKTKNKKEYTNAYIKLDKKISKEAAAKFGEKIMKGEVGTGATLRVAQMTNFRMMVLLQKDISDALNDGTNNIFYNRLVELNPYDSPRELKRKARFLAEKAKHMSTYEQEGYINARVASKLFNAGNTKTIYGEKRLALDPEAKDAIGAADISPIIDKDGKITYQNGHIVEKRGSLGEFGEDRLTKIARNKGIYKARFLDKTTGFEVSEDKLNEYIKDKFGDNLGKTEKVDIFKALEEKFNYAYKVYDFDESGGRKVMLDATEKATMFYGHSGLGVIDEELLDDLKKYEVLKDMNLKYDTRLSEAAITEIKERLVRSGESKYEVNRLIERIQDEKFVLGDAIQGMDFFKNTGATAIASVNKEKHLSVSSPLADIQAVAEDILDDDELEEFTKAMYNTDDVKTIDGKVVYDNSEKISFKSQRFEDFLGVISDKKREQIEFAINHKKWVNSDGKYVDNIEEAIGTVVHSNVAQIRDDESGISSSSLEMKELSGKRDIINKELKDIAKAEAEAGEEGLSNALIEKRQELIDQRDSLDIQERYLKSDKGLKFTERMNLNLSMEAWNQNLITGIENGLENDFQKSMFKKAFGHAIGESGIIDSEHNGKAFLDGLLQRTRDEILFGHGETSLGQAIYENKEAYEYLGKAYDGDHSKISVEKAEMLYSFKSGAEAARLNQEGINEDVVKDMQEKGWKYIDLNSESLDLDIGGQGDVVNKMSNNPYTQDMIVKVGDQHIAMGRMADRVFEDSIIKDEQRKQLNKISHTQADLNELRSTEVFDTEKEKQILNKLAEQVDDFKIMQKKDIFSKSGLAGKINSTRLAMTFAGKGKGLITDKQWLSISENEDNILRRAQFMGSSLADSVSNKFYVDAAFISEDAFREMGYFDEDRMRDFFGKMDNEEMFENAFGVGVTKADIEKRSVKSLEDGMRATLQVYGDAAFTTRFPNIQEASDKMAMIYLDEHLEKNQVMTLSHTGMSAKLDHDGDNFFLAMATRTSRSTDTYLTEMSRHTNDGVNLVGEVNSFMSKKAFTTNRFWAHQVAEKEAKMDKINLAGADIETIGKKRMIDGDLYNRYTPTKGETLEGMIDRINAFNQTYGAVGTDENVVETVKKLGDGSPDKGLDLWLDNAHDAEKNISNRDFILSNGNTIDGFKNEFANAFYGYNYLDEQVAKTSKGSIGTTNVTNFKARMLSLFSMDKKGRDYEYQKNSLVEMLYQAEEAIISSKSAVDTLSMATRAKDWNQNIDKIMNNKSTIEDANAMVGWLEKNVAGDTRLDEMWMKSVDNDRFRVIARDVFEGASDDDILKVLKDNSDSRSKQVFNRVAVDTVQMLQSLGKNGDARSAYNSLREGMSSMGTIQHIKDRVYMGDSIGETVNHALDNMDIDGAEAIKARRANMTIEEQVERVSRNFENSQQESSSFRHVAEGIMEGVDDMFRNSLPKNGLAMGALGLAAGVLVSGFVGGRPRPADVQAMEEAQQAYTPMDGPLMLADPSAMTAGGGSSGYVVNINARTNGDQRRAAQAIQQALGKGMGTNVNVTMNIGNDYSNINNRDIEQAVLATLE